MAGIATFASIAQHVRNRPAQVFLIIALIALLVTLGVAIAKLSGTRAIEEEMVQFHPVTVSLF